VININEIEKDKNRMSQLIQEISAIDFTNFQDKNFMAHYDMVQSSNENAKPQM